MNQTAQMIGALKKCLRAKGMTYCDVAEALDLSEASVKRLFSSQRFSLGRLEAVCRLIDISVFDLARIADAARTDDGVRLSAAQEQALADQPRLLSLFYLLLLGWDNAAIVERLGIDERELLRHLIRLDRLRLIELQPKNRARLLVSNRVDWSPDGPIRRRYESDVKSQFFDYRFDGDDDCMSLENAELSEASIKIIRRKLDRLIAEFRELADIDRPLPPEQKPSIGLMIGYRPWTFWKVVLPEA